MTTREAEIEAVVKAGRSFERADEEYRRAISSGEQPRLSKAGTRYAITKYRLFNTLTTLRGGKEE